MTNKFGRSAIKPRPFAEGLEPRILLSADIPGLDVLVAQTSLDAPPSYAQLLKSSNDVTLKADTGNPGEITSVSSHTNDSQGTTLIIVDPAVNDYLTLIDSMIVQQGGGSGVEVIILNGNQDGISQLSDIFSQRSELSAVHLISHGESGQIYLGNSVVSNDTLIQFSAQISEWGNAFTRAGDLLIYGCNVTESEEGQTWLTRLSELTGIDIAASNDLSGHQSLGGDWVLETSTGIIETTPIVGSQQYVSTLFSVAIPAGEPTDIVFDSEAVQERIINSFMAGKQSEVRLSAFDGGGYVAVWTSGNFNDTNQDGDDEGVYAQRFDALGNPIGGEIDVNTDASNTVDRQLAASVDTFADGRFVIVWESIAPSISSTIYASEYAADGTLIKSAILDNNENNHYEPAVIVLDDTTFLVTWSHYKTSDPDDQKARLYTTTDALSFVVAADEFTIAGNRSQVAWSTEAQITALQGGGFAVSWLGSSGASNQNQMSYLKIYTLDNSSDGVEAVTGSATGTSAVIDGVSGDIVAIADSSLITLSGAGAPDVAGLNNGNVVVVYGDSAGTNISGVIYTADGEISGSEFMVNTSLAGELSLAAVTAMLDGGFTVAWQAENGDGSSNSAILIQRFDSAGNKVGNELKANSTVIDNQTVPDIIELSNGNLQVAWTSAGQDGSDSAVVTSTFIFGAAATVSDAATNGTTVVTVVSVTDVDNSATYTFSLLDDAGGRFSIETTTGIVSVANTSLINVEISAEHNIVVQVEDLTGNAYVEALTITVIDAYEPSNIVPPAQQVLEDDNLIFSVANANPISVDDQLAGDHQMQVTIIVDTGIITLSQLTNLTVVAGVNGSGTITVQGLESNINAALDGMIYFAGNNIYGGASLSITSALLGDQLVKYDFSGGQVLDLGSGIQHDGLLKGDAVGVNNLERGEVMSLSESSSDYIKISGTLGTLDSVTVAAWVNVNGTNMSMINLGNNFGVRIDDVEGDGTRGVSVIHRDSSGYQITSTSAFISGTGWRHVAATFDDATKEVTIYIDGELVTKSDPFSSSIDYFELLNTAGFENGTSYFFNGMMDDVQVFARALDSDEVKALVNGNIAVTNAVAILVHDVDDAAVISGDVSVSGNEGDVVTGTLNASDADGLVDGSYFTVSGQGINGSAVINPTSGLWTYTPTNSNWFGSDSFSVTITDDAGGVTVQVISVSLIGTDDATVISGDVSVSGNEGDVVTGTLNASDADGLVDGSYFTVSGQGTNGSAVINPTSGLWTYTPTNSNWFGSDSFSVTITDDAGGVTVQGISVSLIGTDDAAVISGDVSVSGNEGGVVTGTLNASNVGKVGSGVLVVSIDEPKRALAEDELAANNSTAAIVINESIFEQEISPENEDTITKESVDEIDEADFSAKSFMAAMSTVNIYSANDDNLDSVEDVSEADTQIAWITKQVIANKDIKFNYLEVNDMDLDFSQAMAKTLNELDNARHEVERKHQVQQELMTGVSVAAAGGMMSILLGGTSSIYGAFSSLPVWRWLDPMPIFYAREKDYAEQQKSPDSCEVKKVDNLFDS